MQEENPFELFWQTYPLDLCTRRGSKAKAKVIFDKLQEDMQKQVTINLRELMRADRALKKAGQFVARWPMDTTWLNGERWHDIDDLKPSEARAVGAKTCQFCDQPTGWKNLCWDHYDEFNPNQAIIGADELKQRFIDNGLFHDETKAERTERCRQFAVPRLRAILGGGRQTNGVGEVHGK